MKQKPTLLLLLITIICLQSCNTLYNMHNVELEIMIPAKVKFPDGYNKLALKYNKAALPYIPEFSEYYVGDKKFRDTTNTDSIASEVYFQIFWEEMEKANLFDTIIELPKEHLKKEEIADLIPAVSSDYLAQGEDSSVANSNLYVSKNNEEQFINPQVIARGLNVIQDNISFLEQEEIEEIAKTTNADFLFSFDYFSSEDFIYHYHSVGMEYVYTNAMWSIYDLQKKEHIDVEYKTDTITWESEQSTLRGSVKNLPPRKDAILNAADIAATNFAHHLSPHWVKVERMYYRSGHIDLIKTNELVDNNDWKAAASVWKANTTNKNKNIAAKCMFNMAVACEIQGHLDAALDWVVQSYYVFKDKNELHAKNCTSYIKVLSQRKLDYKTLDEQLN